MANLIPENIRELLTKYTFEIEEDNYDENLICTICKKLMLDVYQSHCGCNYCYQCISDYLNGENKFCPGENADCKEEHLTLDRNVASNPRLNRKILQVKVRCPYESCLCFFTLPQMKEHMRLCDKQDRECPFVNIGCEDGGGLCKDKVMDHLHNKVFTHSKLLIELVENMRNDVNGLKLEIVSLKEEFQRKEMEMERQSREIEDLMEEMEIKEIKMRETEENINNVAKENKNMKEEIKNIKIKMVKMEENINNIKRDNDYLKRDSKNIKDEMEILKKESTKYKNETEANLTLMKKEAYKRKMKDDEETKKMINQKKAKIEICSIGTNTAVAVGEIYLTVDKFSERMKKNEILYSPYFYSHSNGYKLRLQVYPGGRGEGKGSHITLAVCICKGEYDKSLDWPCKYTFNISIINQWTKKDVKSWPLRYLTAPKNTKDCFEKPIDKDNIAIGYPTFMSHKDIEEDLTGGVKVDDCIIMKCFVSVPT